MHFALEEAAISVRTERLHDAHVNEAIVVAQEGFAVEIDFQSAFVEGDACEAEEIVFAIVQIPSDGLAVKAAHGIAIAVVKIAGGFDLKAREDANGFAVRVDNDRGDEITGAILGEK